MTVTHVQIGWCMMMIWFMMIWLWMIGFMMMIGLVVIWFWMIWLMVVWFMMVGIYMMVSWVMKRRRSRTMVSMWSKPVEVRSMNLPKKSKIWLG